jgi:hypothetical protein
MLFLRLEEAILLFARHYQLRCRLPHLKGESAEAIRLRALVEAASGASTTANLRFASNFSRINGLIASGE